MSVISLNEENFSVNVLEAEQPVLVDFWAPWCGPCRQLSPIIEELAAEHPEIRVASVNVDEQPQLAARYQVMGIPAVLLFRGGAPVARSVGLRPKAALEALLK